MMRKQTGMVIWVCLLLVMLAGGVGYVVGRGPFVMARQVETTLKNEALTPLDTLTMDQAACAALAQAVEDEYTQWLSPVQMQDLMTEISGEEAAGIGAELLSVEGGWQVIDVLEESPAQMAGLAKGDLIVKINGEPIGEADWTAEEGVTTLFSVEREGMARDVVIIPQKIEPMPAVISKTLPNGYGYIRIRSFVQEGAENQFEQAMAQFVDAKGVILDVRHNPGGRMDAVLTMLNGCLPDKTEVLCLLEAKGKEERYQTSGEQRYTMPMAVLTDGQSASAAEIFAGVLQNQGRALIVGDTTYGKGVVQKLKTLKDGSGLKYTMAEYRMADGTVIHEKGVTPDIKLTCEGLPGWARTELEDLPLQAAVQALETQQP